ncbi:MAG: hypothetical protein IPG20_22260 [Gammaproteobacteria bacterium]|nr:hypothetical protein [Gammaproteobacteria bacterium]
MPLGVSRTGRRYRTVGFGRAGALFCLSFAKLRGLTGEALFLGRVLVELLPEEPEAKGLLALMLYCEARRPARRDAAGAFVPLAEQDVMRWDGVLIAAAERLLRAAAAAERPGRYQTEAAIQSVHTSRTEGVATPWRALVTLYDVLVQQAPTIGNLIARAAAYGEAEGPEAGLKLLAELPEAAVSVYQPFGRPGRRCCGRRVLVRTQTRPLRWRSG